MTAADASQRHAPNVEILGHLAKARRPLTTSELMACTGRHKSTSQAAAALAQAQGLILGDGWRPIRWRLTQHGLDHARSLGLTRRRNLTPAETP